MAESSTEAEASKDESIHVFWDQGMLNHDTGRGVFDSGLDPGFLDVLEAHPESSDRVKNMISILKRGPIAPFVSWHQGRHALVSELLSFHTQGYPTQASNSSKRNSTDETSTDKDDGTPSSEKIHSFQQQFSPQGLDSIKLTFDEEDADNNEAKPRRAKKESYSSTENELLVKCWIDTSIDSIIGNDQKLDQMWERIAKIYNKNRAANTAPRQWNNLKSHFYTIQKQTRWFCDCYNRIAKEWGSGKSDVDIIEMAQEEYKQRHNKYGFKHIGAWRLLRECPKFTNVDGDVSSKKKMKHSESGAYTSSSANEDDGVDRIRPMGQKLAKRNAKGKGKLVDSELIKEAKEAIEVKNDRATRYIDIEEYKILMKDEEKIKPENRAIHMKMLDKIKKKWDL